MDIRTEEKPIKGITVRQLSVYRQRIGLHGDQIKDFLSSAHFNNSGFTYFDILLNPEEMAVITGFTHRAVVKERNGGTNRQSILETEV